MTTPPPSTTKRYLVGTPTWIGGFQVRFLADTREAATEAATPAEVVTPFWMDDDGAAEVRAWLDSGTPVYI